MKLNLQTLFLVSLFIMTLAITACKNPAGGEFLQVRESQCIGCSKCYDVCATSAITIVNGKAVIDPAACTECGKCVTICPVDAIY